jgi:hypothetical protein
MGKWLSSFATDFWKEPLQHYALRSGNFENQEDEQKVARKSLKIKDFKR